MTTVKNLCGFSQLLKENLGYRLTVGHDNFLLTFLFDASQSGLVSLNIKYRRNGNFQYKVRVTTEGWNESSVYNATKYNIH